MLTLACTRAEAEALPESGDIFAEMADPPTLLVDEPDPDQPDAWVLSAYFDAEPPPALVARICALAPSASAHSLAPLPDADWLVMSQRDLPPVRAGRFVAHTAAHRSALRPGDIGLRVEAGLAFGTGQHRTTHGCLEALAGLAQRRQRVARVADLGTGTGILAMAAARRWPKAKVIASDIDPLAVQVARQNLQLSKLLHGRQPGRVELVTAAGMGHARLVAGAPYGLVIANILAGPLINMARPVAAAVAPGGALVLAGLLAGQARAVARAYRRYGLVPHSRLPGQRPQSTAEWPTLVLVRPG